MAKISIGYDHIEGFPNECSRSGVGTGKVTQENVEVLIGDKVYIVNKETYTGDSDDKSYINYMVHLNNPNLNMAKYNYFAIQVEYYPEYEERYLDLYLEILSTFKWL